MNLHDIENQGYRLEVEAGNLAVYGPEELLTDDRLKILREHKQELIEKKKEFTSDNTSIHFQ